MGQGACNMVKAKLFTVVRSYLEVSWGLLWSRELQKVALPLPTNTVTVCWEDVGMININILHYKDQSHLQHIAQDLTLTFLAIIILNEESWKVCRLKVILVTYLYVSVRCVQVYIGNILLSRKDRCNFLLKGGYRCWMIVLTLMRYEHYEEKVPNEICQ